MFNNIDKPKSIGSEEIYERRRVFCLFWAGVLIGNSFKVIENATPENLQLLKDAVIKFSEEGFSPFFANGPFFSMKPENFYREPDQVWEESLLNYSVETSDVECGTKISYVTSPGTVELFVRWTIPRTEFITKCTSSKKLIYIAMVIAEELIHIIQRRDFFTYRFVIFNTDVELLGRLSQEDESTLQELRELDISYFFHSYLSMYEYGYLQWYADRLTAEDYHYIDSPSYFVNKLLYLVRKYGDIGEFSESLQYEIEQIARRDPILATQLASTGSSIEP